MNSLLTKTAALFLALVLCFGTVSLANAETEYPPRPDGTASDLAGVLGEQTIKDLETLNQRLEDAAGGRIFVLTRHFLGGADAQQYADQVFQVWALDRNDALLLLVIGEENFALTLGAGIKNSMPAETRNTLLGAFRNTYRNRQYDEALGNLAVSLGQTIAKANGNTLNVAGLFGAAAIQSTPQPKTVDDYWYGMFARDDYDARESSDETYWTDWQNQVRYEASSVNWRSVIIWGLVIYFLFFRRRRRRERRRGRW